MSRVERPRGGGAQGGARADVIRRLLALALRRAMVVDSGGHIWYGRMVLSIDDPLRVVHIRMLRRYTGGPCSTTESVAVRSRADEGLSWCRGWSGAAAEALHVAAALT